MSEPILAVDNVVLRFGGVVALDGLSFSVAPHAIHAVIGPNGSGKTTLLNSISGAYVPDSGAIRFAGRQLIGQSPPRIARLGLTRTFQNIRLFRTLSVLENVMTARPIGDSGLRLVYFTPVPDLQAMRARADMTFWLVFVTGGLILFLVAGAVTYILQSRRRVTASRSSVRLRTEVASRQA